ncbi:MAG: hypothetical protein CEE38_20955 [Planctomycetes bacterium B3_Pla]|nr:MAG: hypothetical protein CEE38_20955 [Planctomycetes bacterium B3_Pla]
MSREMLSEIELLKASSKGDTKAFESVVKKYQSLVCAITFSATGDVERSEELAQETFISAWKDLSQLEDLGKFRAWLGSIARNIIKNFFRRQKRDVISKATLIQEMEDGEPSGSGPVQTAITKEQQAVVREALKQIPQTYRVPLVLFYRQQQSVKQVAQQLDLSEETVRQRLFRGRKYLKERVAAMVEDTISRTEPGSTFATAVIASIAGMLAKGSGAAAAAGVAAAASATTTTPVIKTVMSGVTAKIVAAAAAVTIAVGAVAVYKQLTGSTGKSDLPKVVDTPQQIQTVQPEDVSVEPDVMPETAVTQGESVADADKIGSENIAENDLRPTPQEEVAEYQFKSKGVLSGVITDIETGEPVTDAIVRISIGRNYETKTDSNGFYSFDSIEKTGNYDIAIDSKEYIGIAVGQRQPIVSLAPGKQVVKHFQLAWACQVDLRVVDENGVGIEGAKVVATSLADANPKVVSYFGSIRQTDAKGHILLGGFTPVKSEYLITVWHETTRTVRKPDGRLWGESDYDYAQARRVVKLTDPQVVEQIEIVLKKGIEVKGHAEYSDGVPADDIEIVARPAWWHCNYGVHGYEIGPEGDFAIKHITPGRYDICAYFPRTESGGGSTKTVFQAQLPLAEDELLIVRIPEKSPESLASISGTLVYLGEKKPRYVYIDAYSPTTGHAHTSVRYNSNNEVKDYFVLDRLEPGRYRLTFSGSNLEEKVIENVQAPSEGLEVELLYLTKPKLMGTVVDAKTGEPVKSFRMRARKLRTLRGRNYGQNDQWAYFADEEGRFTLDVVGPGIYQLQAAAGDYAPTWSTQVSTDEPANVLVELGFGGSIKGTVANEDEEQITGAKVIPLSIAGGTMPRTFDVFVSEEGAVETIGGEFTLKHLPAGTETLKVVHPMYAFSISEGIEVVDGQTAVGVKIVLKKGATVEGYVYDADGEPEAGVALYIQGADNYGGSGDEQEGRLGTAIADSNGFYRVSGLPEKMCSVRREKEWQSLGVVSRALMPKSGEVSRLDLGGTPVVTGTVVVDDELLIDKRILLGPADSPHFGLFKCYARTNGAGRFAFRGAVEGPHAIYYENPDKRSDWIKIVDIDVASADLSLGVITPADVSRLLVTINGRQFDTKLAIKRIYISKAGKVFGVPISKADPPDAPGKPWVISNVEPGRYVLNLTRSDQVQMRKDIELALGQSQWEVTMEVPESTAGVSGKIVGNTPSGLAFWREGMDVFGAISMGREGAYKIENLPSGTYFIGSVFGLLNNMSKLAEFKLLPGRNEIVDLDLTGHIEQKMAYLVAQVMDERNQLRGDAEVWLERDSQPIETWQSTPQGHIFLTVPGKYVLHVAAQGYRKVEKSIALDAFEPGVGRPKTMLVHLEKE